MRINLSPLKRWIVLGLVVFGFQAVGTRAETEALQQPFPRTLNYGWLTDSASTGEIEALEGYSGVVVDTAQAAAAADAFKDRFGASKALFALIDWQGKDPAETDAGASGPALSSVFPGHFLYYQGASIDRQLLGLSTQTSVHVDKIALFEVGDEALLVPVRVSSGRPVFDPSGVEIVKVTSLSADASGNGGTLTVERAQRGTTAKEFQPLYARAFPHATLPQEAFWRWNLALNCPLNSQGVPAWRVVADWLAPWLTTTHPTWDGLILGGARGQLDAASLGNPGGEGRGPDTNADLTPDWGYASGVNEFGLGQVALSTRLRDQIGTDRNFVMGCAPSTDAAKVSPLPGPGGENGLWMERFPESDPGGDFDSAFARLSFWRDHRPAGTEALALVYTQENTEAYGDGSGGNAPFRLGLAAACLIDGWHAYTTRPDQSPYQDAVYSWDEYTAGTENRPGWLGQPLEPAVRHDEGLGDPATDEPIPQAGWTTRLNASGAGAAADPPQAEGATAVRIDVTGVAAPLPSLDDIDLISPSLGVLDAGEATLRFRAKAAFSDATPPPARDLRVGIELTPGGFLEAGVVPLGTDWRDYSLEVTLAASGQGKLVFRVGGPRGSVWVDQPEIRWGSADRFSRRFQGGIVLLNAGEEPFLFQLDGVYRRIDGTVDPGVNDGATGLAEELVPPHDARFLLIDQSAPTPTAPPTVSPTESVPPTASPVPTTTFPPTLSPTPDLTDLPTLTPLDWPTFTPSPTRTPTPSRSPSPSVTPSVTPTQPPTPPPTESPTVTPSPSPSPAATPSPTVSPIPTLSPVPTPPPPDDVFGTILGRGGFTPEEMAIMDRNGDGVIDVADAVLLLGQ